MASGSLEDVEFNQTSDTISSSLSALERPFRAAAGQTNPAVPAFHSGAKNSKAILSWGCGRWSSSVFTTSSFDVLITEAVSECATHKALPLSLLFSSFIPTHPVLQLALRK
ncbi:unnamed protein product [Nippostrongylus brasiliensis]|uniref:Uncharacterized protein n=1 Tax=Nippostrongylus brasiliensis TaxID=27835 RepID=A0A0N4Y584_NIPBR|nr:unnamed protein product [Nippostrongylus brasiliensis]